MSSNPSISNLRMSHSVKHSVNPQISSLEQALEMKVKPALRELWNLEIAELYNYVINLEPGDLVKDTIEFLDYVQKNRFSDVRDSQNVLIHHSNPKVVKELLEKLYVASRVDSQVYMRLNKDVKAMKQYHVKLEQDVRQLQVEYQRILREQQLAEQV